MLPPRKGFRLPREWNIHKKWEMWKNLMIFYKLTAMRRPRRNISMKKIIHSLYPGNAKCRSKWINSIILYNLIRILSGMTPGIYTCSICSTRSFLCWLLRPAGTPGIHTCSICSTRSLLCWLLRPVGTPVIHTCSICFTRSLLCWLFRPVRFWEEACWTASRTVVCKIEIQMREQLYRGEHQKSHKLTSPREMI